MGDSPGFHGAHRPSECAGQSQAGLHQAVYLTVARNSAITGAIAGRHVRVGSTSISQHEWLPGQPAARRAARALGLARWAMSPDAARASGYDQRMAIRIPSLCIDTLDPGKIAAAEARQLPGAAGRDAEAARLDRQRQPKLGSSVVVPLRCSEELGHAAAGDAQDSCDV